MRVPLRPKPSSAGVFSEPALILDEQLAKWPRILHNLPDSAAKDCSVSRFSFLVSSPQNSPTSWVYRCAGSLHRLGPPGYRQALATSGRAAGTEARLLKDRAQCCSGEPAGPGPISALAVCCHPADQPLSSAPHSASQTPGKRISEECPVFAEKFSGQFSLYLPCCSTSGILTRM